MMRLLCVGIGYVFGLFQTSYIYGKIKGIDIREHGSGNAGATNALRTLGKSAGIITFLGDGLKCLLAVWLVRILFSGMMPEDGQNWGVLLGMYASLGVILGHNFPFYLGFRGGKGIAATGGMLASLDPLLTGIAIVVFLGTTAITRYVSLGSILVLADFLIGVFVYGFLGKWGLTGGPLYEMYAITVFLTGLALFRHRENIQRLLRGTERKIGERAEIK